MKLIYLLIITLSISFSNAQELGHEQKSFFFTNYVYYNNGEEIEREEYKEFVKNDALAFQRFDKHLRNKKWANVLTGVSNFILGFNIGNWIAGNGFSWGSVGVSAILFNLPAYLLNRKAEKLLNKLEDGFNDQVSVKFIGNEYGAGIGFRF